jgi:pimeloyl-ACP methyl ester carboxylesterase
MRHLAYERNGVSYRGTSIAFPAALGSPLVFLSDLGRGVSRLPLNAILSAGKILQTSELLSGQTNKNFPVKGQLENTLAVLKYGTANDKPREHFLENGLVYRANGHRGMNINVTLGTDHRSPDPIVVAKSIVTYPAKLATEPILDALGTPAWGNMLRRTRSMFHPSENYIAQHSGKNSREIENERAQHKIGAATIFFQELANFMESHPDVHLDVIAHSMGTIVMNEAFVLTPHLRVRNLVYMAAACSIRDFQASAGRYLNDSRCKTDFYNLSLHPRAELDESEFKGIPMKGSLLVWIDEFFQAPESFGDRTLGTFENAVIAKDFLPDTPRVHLKAFPMHGPCPPGLCLGPQTHPDFTTYAFWRQNFWATDYSVEKESTYRKLTK